MLVKELCTILDLKRKLCEFYCRSQVVLILCCVAYGPLYYPGTKGISVALCTLIFTCDWV